MDQPLKRFVVLRHEVGSQLTRTDQSHIDWMFEVGGVLRTWATQVFTSFDKPMDMPCDLLGDHRVAYLDFEGEIAGDRGRVIRLLAGTYQSRDSNADQFIADLSWDDGGRSNLAAGPKTDASGEAVVTCYRSFLPDPDLRLEESRDCWRLRFSPGR